MVSLFRGLLWGFGFVLNLLPRYVHNLLGCAFGIFTFDILRIRRDVILSNISIAFPQLEHREKCRIGRASMASQGRILIEYFLMTVYRPSWTTKYFSFEGLEHYDRALEGRKGIFLLTLHLGNGDFCCAGMAQRGYGIHLITKKAKQDWLNEVWFGLRTRLGTKLIAHERSNSEILRALKKNECVIWVLDQFMGPPSGVKTTFFGKETGTARGMAVFVERTGVAVLPCYNYRRPDGGFHVVIEPPMTFAPPNEGTDYVTYLTQEFTHKLEEFVRVKPEQWMWIHRRWKKFG